MGTFLRLDIVTPMWENPAVAMTEGVIRGGLADADSWLEPDEMRWFAPPTSQSDESPHPRTRGRATLRHVEASLGDLSRAAAAALAPHPLVDGSGAIAIPAPGLPPRAGERSYRDSRRRGWSPRRRRRFATRFVPAATLVVSAAVTLPSLLARDDRGARLSAVTQTSPRLLQGDASVAPISPTPPAEPNAGRRLPADVTPFQIANLGSGDLGVDSTIDSSPAGSGIAAAAIAAEALVSNPAEAPVSAPAESAKPKRRYEKIQWRDSEASGLPFGGHLHDGVALPVEGPNWITWDPTFDRVPNRAWRLHGTDKLIRMIVNIAKAHRVAHPGAPPLLVGDISATEGGPLDQHVSHQNGLDVDIYYPRKDGKPTEPTSPSQIDVALAQDLVDRFVKAGAQFVFVGYNSGLGGPGGIVQPYPNHENHMHVRIRP